MLFAIFSERTLQSFFTVKVEIFIKPGLHTTVTAMQAETDGLGLIKKILITRPERE